jgi:hypothetical protein
VSTVSGTAEDFMSSLSANKLLVLLERVLSDALTHEADTVLVCQTPHGLRFETDSGASLAFVPHGQASWKDIFELLTRLNTDAAHQGHADCVTLDEMEDDVLYIHLKAHQAYFSGNLEAIIGRLKF